MVNARVWTGNSRQPWASGIAVDEDKVIAVASSAEVAKLVVKSTRVIDAKGNLLCNPGGTIERGGSADFVLVAGDSIPGDVNADPSSVIMKVTSGKIAFELGQK